MKKYIASISVLTLCAAAVIALPVPSRAQDNANMAAAETPAKKSDLIVYKGTVKSVDAAAKTITVGDQTFTLGADAKLTKDGQAMKLDDIKAGDEVRGHYKKTEDGKLEAISVHEGQAAHHKKKDAGADAGAGQ
jgi:ribosomal protein L18E